MQLVAYALLPAVLPSSLWRLPAALDNGLSLGERIYVVIPCVHPQDLAVPRAPHRPRCRVPVPRCRTLRLSFIAWF